MTELTRIECADWFLDRDRFVILTHRKPDGDTLGSAAGLCRGLRLLGKTAHVLENPEVTPLFAPLMEGLCKPEPEEGDLLVAVDVAADTMFPRAWDALKNSIDLRIDHHGSGRVYTPVELVESDSASCAEIIWVVLLEMGALKLQSRPQVLGKHAELFFTLLSGSLHQSYAGLYETDDDMLLNAVLQEK